MDRARRSRDAADQPPGKRSSGEAIEDQAPAERDAEAILARIKADEKAADQARDAYQRGQIEPLTPDARIAHLLAPDEHLLAIRRSVGVERRVRDPSPEEKHGLAGDLYLTSRRIVLIGRVPLSFDLDEIEETVLAGERCLVVTRDGRGVALDVDQPRLLRVEISAARTADAKRATDS